MTGITLKADGIREVQVSVEEAERMKARFEKDVAAEGAVVTTVDLSCRQWSPEAVKVLQPILTKVAPTIVVLNIADTIAGLLTDVGFEVMELFTECFQGAKELVEVSMEYNATGPRVLKRIAPILGNSKVTKLNFNNCGLSAETIPQLDDALGGTGVSRLTHLTLDRNMVGVEGARCVGDLLATCDSLVAFSFCGCRPTKAGSKFIAQGLLQLVENLASKGTVSKMIDLNLYDGDFGEDALEDLVKALEKMPNLTHLNLRDAGTLGEEWTGKLAEAVKSYKLEDFDLGACELGPDGAEIIAELLRGQLGSLKSLNLETNELENDGMEKIIAAFKGDNILTYLKLDENELDDAAIDILLGANLPNLRVLSLKENMDLEEATDEKKEQLRNKFPGAAVLIADEDEEPKADIEEQADADVDALADALAGL